MFPATTYAARRAALAEKMGSGLLLLPANGEAPMNCHDNVYPFRQDSSFRYFAGHDLPDLVLTVDGETGESRLYGNDYTLDMVVWMGEQPAVRDLATRCGAEYGGSLPQLVDHLRGREVHYLPPYRAERREQLREWAGHAGKPSEKFIRAVISLRSVKSEAELAEMDKAVVTSMVMHNSARAHAKPGMLEAEVAGLVEGIAIQGGGRLAYPAIVTRNGHILHNHYHGNQLRKGDLLLIDAGAETPSGYAGDITRTFSVGTGLSSEQQAVHDIVDRAKSMSIAALRPAARFRDIHDQACLVLANGLKDLGIMTGDPAEAVAGGAHALFMPHGLGHMIGLDVHDMEDLGEDLVGYDEATKRSTDFGTRSLRLGRALQPGFALTVEPGIYFIPALIDRWEADGTGKEFINFEELRKWRDFGGIRLEDNIAITREGHRVLG